VGLSNYLPEELLEGRINIYTGKENFTLENPDYELSVENSLSLYYLFSDDVNSDGSLDIIVRSNFNWNANFTLLYFFYGGENSDNIPDKKFEIRKFRVLFPLIDIETHSNLIIGYNSNKPDKATLKVFFPKGNRSLNELEVLNEIFFPVNRNQFMSYTKDEATKIDIYSVKRGSFIKVKTGDFFNYDSIINPPERFRLTEYSKQQLIFPIIRDGREFITFVELSE